MVISKDDLFSRAPRPQIIRSKSVGAITRRSQDSMDCRKHKKKPYSSTINFRRGRSSRCSRVAPSVTNTVEIPGQQGFSDQNFDLANTGWDSRSTLNELSSRFGLEHKTSMLAGSPATQCTTPSSRHLERLSIEKSVVKGSNLCEDIPDYHSNSLISLAAIDPRNKFCVATGTLTDNAPAIHTGQPPGQLRQECSQVVNDNMTNVNLQKALAIQTFQADSLSAGLVPMENSLTEILVAENKDRRRQHKLDDAPSTRTRQYVHQSVVRGTRRPLATCSLQDNQLNIHRMIPTGNTVDSLRAGSPTGNTVDSLHAGSPTGSTVNSLHVGQSVACQHRQCIPVQVSNCAATMSQQFNYDENGDSEAEFGCSVCTEEQRHDCNADQPIYSPIFTQCLDNTQQNTQQNTQLNTMQNTQQSKQQNTRQNTLANREVEKLTDEDYSLGCGEENIHPCPYSLRRQDTVLLQQDDNIHDDDDDGDFDSVLESLKKFLCQEVPDDSDVFQNHDDDEYLQENTWEDKSDMAGVSYKNLLNYPTRYQCSMCDSNLEVVPFQQYVGDCEDEYFPCFILEDNTRQTDMYCPQCRCLRSIYCPE